MAALSSITHFRVIGAQQVSAISANKLPSRRKDLGSSVDAYGNEFCTRASLSSHGSVIGTSQRHGVPLVSRKLAKCTFATRQAANKHHNYATVVNCRAGTADQVDKYGHCKCIEDAFTSIMKDTIQHCLNKENDVMRDKVLGQMGRGLAALCRVSVVVAAESTAPIPIASMVPELSTIRDEDLEQVQRLLHLTALPFNSTGDEDFKRLTKMLQKTGDEQEGSKRTLTKNELSQICERLGSDMVQNIGPMVMCFSELPLWAKHRALLLPAEVAGKVAFSLLTGPTSRR